MEINITSFAETNAFPYSHSVFEGGPNAGRNTWEAAQHAAVLLDTPAKVQAMRDHAKGFGAWDADEIAAWTDEEVNALFVQLISGDIREAGADSLTDIDWEEYERQSEAGQIAGRMFRGIDGDFYYYLGE